MAISFHFPDHFYENFVCFTDLDSKERERKTERKKEKEGKKEEKEKIKN